MTRKSSGPTKPNDCNGKIAPKKIFEHNESGDRWYVGGVMNTCFNCVDRHVEAGMARALPLFTTGAMTGTKSQISYAELLDRVQCVATMMQR